MRERRPRLLLLCSPPSSPCSCSSSTGRRITIVDPVIPGAGRRADLPDDGALDPLVPGLWTGGLPDVDIWAAFWRSRLGLVVMVLTVVLSLLAGLAFRKRFGGRMRCSTSPSPA